MMGDSGGFPGYTIKDRRWWAHADDEGRAREAEPEAQKPTQIAALEAELEERDRRLREALTRERQAVAELDQVRSRLERDARKEIERARRDLVLSLLPVLDDLDRAIAAGQSGPGDALLVGVELVRSHFLDRLRGLGVDRFDPTGEGFDPTRHEAVSTVPVAEPSRSGRVAATLRPGYAFGDETLRPAQVVVSRVEPRSWL
jgi:molecular chaperone GrpE